MRMRSFGLGLLAVLVLVLGSGCKKSPPAGGAPSQTTNQPSTTLARVHWLGKNRIAAQKTSKQFMSIWNLPEAARLEAQTLDKLAVALAAEKPLGISNLWSVASNQVSAGSSQPAEDKPGPPSSPKQRCGGWSAVRIKRRRLRIRSRKPQIPSR